MHAFRIVAAGMSAVLAGAAAPGLPARPIALQFPAAERAAAISGIPTWNYQYSYGNTYWNMTFAGRNPQRDTVTTLPVYLIPVRISYHDAATRLSYSPLIRLRDGRTVLQHVIASPVFQPADFVFGGVRIGNAQYLDAAQKANVWNAAGQESGYHTNFGAPVVAPLQQLDTSSKNALTTPSVEGATNPILPYITWLDPALQRILGTLPVPPHAVPVFLLVQTYGFILGQGCCIGSFHNVTATGQPYVVASYILNRGAFSEDVSGLSAGMGGFLTDPFYTNQTPCGLYDAGAPFVGLPNYGTHAYRLGGTTYHLEDLALLPYFRDSSGATLQGLSGTPDVRDTFCAAGP